jgi:HK97 family phage major capsid protein
VDEKKLQAIKDEILKQLNPKELTEELVKTIGDKIREEVKAELVKETQSRSPYKFLGDNEKEEFRKDFNMGNVIKKVLTGTWPKHSGIEKAAVEEYTEKALSEGELQRGGFLVPEEAIGDIRDTIQSISIFGQIPDIQRYETSAHPLVIPTIESDASAYWIQEGSEPTETDITFGMIKMYPRKLGALLPMTEEIVKDSSPSAEQIARRKLGEAMAYTIDTAFLTGDGYENEPLGLINFPGIGTGVNVGTNGGTATFDDLHTMLYHIESNNYDLGGVRWIAAPRTWRDLNMYKDADGKYMIQSDLQSSLPSQKLLGYPVITSTRVPVTDTKGTCTTASKLILGNFRYMIVAQWQGMELRMNDSIGFKSGTLWLKAVQRIDVSFERLTSFDVTEGIIPAYLLQ